MQDERSTIKTNVLTANTAQTVRNRLREMESKRAHVLTRWVWELLQNARDAATPGAKGTLVASMERSQTELVFKHNGVEFNKDQIAHLIYHGSTKTDDSTTIGQYGTGFLSTHLLSPEINVSGWLNDGKKFDFELKREASSDDLLSKSMDKAYHGFWESLTDIPRGDDFTTQFRYPLNLRDDATEAVEKGVEALQRCAPFVVVFNKEFSSIEIKSPNGSVTFKVIGREPTGKENVHLVKVAEIENRETREKRYIVTEGLKASVAIPMELANDVCLPVDEIPKLFLGFPLINTEDFSFPAVVNSIRFSPTENRNGVAIGLSDDEASRENQSVIEEACRLLVDMLQFAARRGWQDAHLLAKIPAIQGKEWLDESWVRNCLMEQLVGKIRQLPLVINESDEVIPPSDLELPFAETNEGTETLRDLLGSWEGAIHRLPRRNEVTGWSAAAKTWAEVLECDVSSFNEVTDGRKLAKRIHEVSHVNPTTHRLNLLKLRDGVEGVEWLDRFIGFLIAGGLNDVIDEYRLVPSQGRFLRTLSRLHRDDGIDDELKNLAELLGRRIRRELRDTDVTSLQAHPGSGGWDNEHVVTELIKNLRERAEREPDGKFTEASARLFAWLVGHEKYDHMRGFPAFAIERGSAKTTVVHLPSNAQDRECPLAPIRAWPEDLQQFSDLFPPTGILADAFFEQVPEVGAWQKLKTQSFVRTSVVMTNDEVISKFYPDHPLAEATSEHRTSNPVRVTDIFNRSTVMDRVRDSQDRARLFWRFLTEWLVAEAADSLEIRRADCECGSPHHYYPAAYLEPLRESAWVRLENSARAQATAETLADLLRGRWDPALLSANPIGIRLLEAMGITQFDLLRVFSATSPDQLKEQDQALAEILVASGGNINRLSHAREYVEDLEDDENLADVLKKRRERKQRVIENQTLGKQVEKLVKDSLKGVGFAVRRKPIGSDFEIENDVVEKDGEEGAEEEVGIEVTGNGSTWLVEVKATRGQSDVGMTPTQARTAVAQDTRFLLCVVPVAPRNAQPILSEVRGSMRFVQNMGPRVASACNVLGNLDRMHDRIHIDSVSDVHLEVVRGTARVRIKSSVWEDESDGFSIGDLRGRLLGQGSSHKPH